MDAHLAQCKVLDEETYLKAKRMGYPDKLIEALSGLKAKTAACRLQNG